MKTIRFKENFRGRETKEVMFEAGDTGEFEDEVAETIVAMGKAVLIEAPQAPELPEMPKAKPAPARKGKAKK